MKQFTVIPVLLSLMACGPASKSQTSSAIPLHSLGRGLIFSKDLRPVDGPLTELIILKTAAGYTAKLHTLSSGFGSDKPIDTITELGAGLSCFAAKNVNVIKVITCSRDDRPVDGRLTELSIKPNGSGTFDASLLSEYTSRVTGQVVRETKDLAADLSLQDLSF